MRLTASELRQIARLLELWDAIPALDSAAAQVTDENVDTAFWISANEDGEATFETPTP